MNNKFLEFALKPEVFFQNHMKIDLLEMPYIKTVILLYVIGIFWDRYEKLLMWVDLLPIMVIVIIFFISVNIYFYLGSFFYNIRVCLSWGTKNVKLSRKLYSKIYLNIFFVLIGLVIWSNYLIWNWRDLFSISLNITLSMSMLILIFLWTYHSIYISYRSITKLSDVKKIRAIIFFLILPIIFSTIFILLWVLSAISI